MVHIVVVIARLGVSRGLASFASSNGFPVGLDVGAIKIVWSMVIMIARLRIRRDLSWFASSN